MPKIKIRNDRVGFEAGTVMDVSDRRAERWCSRGFAELVGAEPKSETKSAEPKKAPAKKKAATKRGSKE